tara:strand:- start:242 stop:646 length:405 start_codon:yes stop_codon:yes gene_type:complete
MTRVSNQKLDKLVAKEIWNQLGETIGRLSASKADPFLESILTPTEQIMLAKRLAIIVLIDEGHTDYAISKTLRVSSSTVARLRETYNFGSYRPVLSGLKKNKADYVDFVNTLVDVIHIGLPRYAGPDRWKLLKK